MRVETDTDREAVCLRRFNSRHAAAVRSWHKPDLRRTAAVRPKPDPWYAQKSTKSDPELPFSLRRSLTGLARPRPLPQQTGAAAGRYALPKSPSCAPPACDGIATAAKIQTEPSLPEEVPCLRQLRPVRVSLDAQVHELLIGLPDRALVPHERSGTRRAENAAEPVRVGAKHRLVLLKRRRGVVALKQEIAKQLARRDQRPGGCWVLVHGPLELGRCPAQLKRACAVALDLRQDGSRTKPLDLHLVGPVVVVRRDELVLEPLQLRDLRLRRREIADVRSAERPREAGHGRGPGEALPGELHARRDERRGSRPIPSLERVTRRDGGQCV